MANAAETIYPLDAKCFFQTFLNVKENSKGYNGASIRGEKTRMVKSLITPFRRGRFNEERSFLAPPNCCLGRCMFEFAWNNSSLFKTGNNQSQGNVYGYGYPESASLGCLHGTQQTSSDILSSSSEETPIFKHRGSVQEEICSNPVFRIGDCLQFEGNFRNDSDCEDDDDIGEHVFDSDGESDICDSSNNRVKDKNFASEFYVNNNEQNSGTPTSYLSVACGNLQDSDNDQMFCNASESYDQIYSKISGTEEGSFGYEEIESVRREKDCVTSDTTGDLHLDHVTSGGKNNHITHVAIGAENRILGHVTNGTEISYFDKVFNDAEKNHLSHVITGAKNNSVDHVTSGAKISQLASVNNDTEISDLAFGTNNLDDVTISVENHDNGYVTSGSKNHHLVVTNGVKNHCLGHVTNGTENSIVQAHPDEPPNGILQQQQKLFSSQSISTTRLADTSVKFKISLLDSILIGPENQDNAISYDYELCGKLAVLLGFLSSSNPNVIQLTHNMSVGLFDYLDGTVRPLEHSEVGTGSRKNLLSRFLTKLTTKGTNFLQQCQLKYMTSLFKILFMYSGNNF